MHVLRTLTRSFFAIDLVRRLVRFGLVGAVVFVLGTAAQWWLLRIGVASDPSYVYQTALSVELSYLLNWRFTFGDRHAPFWRSALRWNVQKAVLVAPNCLAYDQLTHVGLGWMAANCVTTVVFLGINFAAANLWSFAARRLRISWLGASITAVIIGTPVAIALLPQLRPLVYVAWMTPCLELALLAAGTQFYRHRFRERGDINLVIIQVTTRGREAERVNEILAQIRGYHLDLPAQFWVVTEPDDDARYAADYVLRVPGSFACRARHKGRALEYSRTVRRTLGLDRDDVKLIFMDDDVTPTRAYIETAARADYDVCEGVVTPRTGYGFRPIGHFLASHADDIRTQACLVWCSVFQGIFHHPLHVHGEGLAMTGAAEARVGWDRDCMSEDLSFGQAACRAGLRWGWFHEYVEITSPWTLRDYLIQRRRWIWGDVQAVRSREVMGWCAAARVCGKYLQGVLVLSCSAVGLWLRLTGRIPATAGILNFGKLALLAWVGLVFACGWVAASSAHGRRSDDSRLLSGVLAVLMAPFSIVVTFAAIILPLLQGDPGEFKVIRKTKEIKA